MLNRNKGNSDKKGTTLGDLFRPVGNTANKSLKIIGHIMNALKRVFIAIGSGIIGLIIHAFFFLPENESMNIFPIHKFLEQNQIGFIIGFLAGILLYKICASIINFIINVIFSSEIETGSKK